MTPKSVAQRAALIAKGKSLAQSGAYVPKRCEFLGRLDGWGLDVYAGSPRPWIDALIAEARHAAQ